MKDALPKKLTSYLRDTGARALDRLADTVPQPASGARPDALQTLTAHWRDMTPDERNRFVDRLAMTVGEVIAASALLPAGIAIGKKAVKSARKVFKRSAKTLRKRAGAPKKAAAAKKAAPKPAKKSGTTSKKSAKKSSTKKKAKRT